MSNMGVNESLLIYSSDWPTLKNQMWNELQIYFTWLPNIGILVDWIFVVSAADNITWHLNKGLLTAEFALVNKPL